MLRKKVNCWKTPWGLENQHFGGRNGCKYCCIYLARKLVQGPADRNGCYKFEESWSKTATVKL